MNTITRRLFLRSSASLGSVAAMGIAPAVAAANLGADENLELHRLDAEFRAAHAVYMVDEAVLTGARERFNAMRPSVPDVLVVDRREGQHTWLSEQERDGEGNMVWPEGHKPGRRLYDSAALEKHFAPFNRRSKTGRIWAERYDAALGYETEFANAVIASGLREAADKHYYAVRALRDIAYAIAKHKATTLAGIMVKANSVACLAAVGGDQTQIADYLSRGMVMDVVAVLRGASS